jgi:hypothetical protein
MNMRNLAQFVLTLGFLTGGALAQAGILLEPMIGYTVNGSTDDGAGNTTTYTGLEYGARLGVSITSFLIGGEYRSSPSTTLTASPATAGYTQTGSSAGTGVFVGFEFPAFPLRIIATYFFQDTMSGTLQGPLTNSTRDFSGTAIKVGIHYKIIPMVSVGIESLSGTYTKSSSGGVETTLNPPEKSAMLNAVVSFPFSF